MGYRGSLWSCPFRGVKYVPAKEKECFQRTMKAWSMLLEFLRCVHSSHTRAWFAPRDMLPHCQPLSTHVPLAIQSLQLLYPDSPKLPSSFLLVQGGHSLLSLCLSVSLSQECFPPHLCLGCREPRLSLPSSGWAHCFEYTGLCTTATDGQEMAGQKTNYWERIGSGTLCFPLETFNLISSCFAWVSLISGNLSFSNIQILVKLASNLSTYIMTTPKWGLLCLALKSLPFVCPLLFALLWVASPKSLWNECAFFTVCVKSLLAASVGVPSLKSTQNFSLFLHLKKKNQWSQIIFRRWDINTD